MIGARREIIKLPPGALQGLKEGVADEMFASAFCWGEQCGGWSSRFVGV